MLENRIRDIEEREVPGLLVEAGVALGGSAIIMSALMSPGRSFHGYDVFGMIPPPSERDGEKARSRYRTIRSGASRGIGGDTYYGYQEDLYEVVVRNFAEFGLSIDGIRLSLHKGEFEDTLVFAPGTQVAMAHIDCDWHAAVRLSLERIYPALAPGGYMVLDDYNDFGGCRRAVHEFLAECPDIVVVNGETSLTLRRGPLTDT